MTNKNFKNSCLTAWQWCYCVSLRAPRLQRSPSCHPERVSSVSLYTRQPWFSADGGSIGNPRAIFLFFFVHVLLITREASLHHSYAYFTQTLFVWLIKSLLNENTRAPELPEWDSGIKNVSVNTRVTVLQVIYPFWRKSWVSNALTV